MGVLDEAIREHLELKRRRGADPGEVKREEDEALGAVERGRSQRDAADVAEAESEHEASPGFEPAQATGGGQPTTAFEASDIADALGEPEPAPAESLAPSPAEESLEQDEEPAAPDEDELEQTPDFMKESPDHDKLWFEQKPPKDFDF